MYCSQDRVRLSTLRYMSESHDVAPAIAGVVFTRFPLGFPP